MDGDGAAEIKNVRIGVSADNEIDTTSGNFTRLYWWHCNNFRSSRSKWCSTFSNNVGVVGLTTTKTLEVIETSTFGGNLNASFVGASSTVFTTKLGVGTTEFPVNDIC